MRTPGGWPVPALTLWAALVLSSVRALAGEGPDHQLEVTLPAKVVIEPGAEGSFRFGILARQSLRDLRLEGRPLVGSLPAGASLRFRSDGTLLFARSDLLGGRLRSSWLAPADDPDEIDLRDPANALSAPGLIAELQPPLPRRLIHVRAVDAVLWSGDLVWHFDFGRPVRRLVLSRADEGALTRVSNFEGEMGLAFSADGTHWTTAWRLSEPAEQVAVEAALPGSLRRSRSLWIRLRAADAALHAFHLTAELEATDLIALLDRSSRQHPLELIDAKGSSHQALLFGKKRELPVPEEAGRPTSTLPFAPEIRSGRGWIRVTFPEGSGIELTRTLDGGILGVRAIFVKDRKLVGEGRSAAEAPEIALEMVGPGAVGGVRNWKAYLRQRKEQDMAWPRRGGRRIRTLPFSDLRYLGALSEQGEVRLRFAAGEHGRVELALAPVQQEWEGRRFAGLAWQVRTAGMKGVIGLRIVENAMVRAGSWSFQQLWGKWVERRADFVTPFALPRSWYFADSQPFHFQAGLQGIQIATFDRPVAARVAVEERAGRLRIESSIPVAAAEERGLRITPWRIWLDSSDPVADKWAALDQWTKVYDALADGWREDLGLHRTRAEPLLWYSYALEPRDAVDLPAGDGLFAELAGEALDVAAHYGFARFLVDGPWESDWEHPASDYLPGSASFGSANAPWRLSPSPSLGGRPALARLARRARELGIGLLLWITPGHLSNSSPLLVEHPEWLRWRVDGRPEDADYGDITGTAMESGWFDYAAHAVTELAHHVPFAGFLVDSWLTFGIYADARAAEPSPSLTRSIALQQAWRKAGLGTIILEGVGPFGLSGGGYGGELLASPEEAPVARRAFAAIRGREYGLYRYVADTEVEPESYYRTLASGGSVSINILDFMERLDEPTRRAVRRVNRDHARVRDLMERRHLIGRGDRWLGVSWRRDDGDEIALFAFAGFSFPTAGRDQVEDVTRGEHLQVSGSLRTEPFHTYRLRSN